MSKTNELIIPIIPCIDEATAELCLKAIEIYLNRDSGIKLIGETKPDGSTKLYFKRLWEKTDEQSTSDT